MMKPIVLVILAAFFSSSLVLAKADDVLAPVSPKLRGAASAGVPVIERNLQSDVPITCYQDFKDGTYTQVDCNVVGSCTAFSCCANLDSCIGVGQELCEIATGFAIETVNEPLCTYKFSCCY